ncbi:hypothetical protein [Variovorax sp. PBL-H6]|nr:hypothetical protein [Variovorax sp. PBL-H6]
MVALDAFVRDDLASGRLVAPFALRLPRAAPTTSRGATMRRNPIA